MNAPRVGSRSALVMLLAALLMSTACSDDAAVGGDWSPGLDGGPESGGGDTVFGGGDIGAGASDGFGKPDGGGFSLDGFGDWCADKALFAEPCAQNGDCCSGLCVESTTGPVCTEECVDQCPDGWVCKSILNFYPDLVFACVPAVDRTCSPCKEDFQCNQGRCVDFPDGRFCVALCDVDPCPGDTECVDVQTGDGTERRCLPPGGSCTCNDKTDGTQRPCTATGPAGTCIGFETCTSGDGWGGCDAPTPAEETCNGLDDDCNGVADDGLAGSAACEKTNAFGACAGIATCQGSAGTVCSAAEPAAEACNFKDDDCDGLTDEDFKTGEAYTSDAHCGTCNAGCAAAIPHATGRCDGDLPIPSCVVDTCEDGFFPANPFQCLPAQQTLCTPCAIDLTCAGGVCKPIGGGTYCTLPCPDGACPDGMGCKGGVCVPDNGTCDCSAANGGVKRPCSKTNGVGACFGAETCDPAKGWVGCDAQAPAAEVCNGLDDDCDGVPDDGIPQGVPCERSNGFGTCPGVATCLGSAGVQCSAKEPAAEACNFVDDDCDGQVDEDFRTGGLYVGDAHCGTCNAPCAGAIPNATAHCEAQGGVPVCTVESCAPGTYKANPYQCLPVQDTTCAPCQTDQTCAGGLCRVIGGASYCTPACATSADCGGGACAPDPAGGPSGCVPANGTCDCSAANGGVKRPCSKANGVGTCFGLEQCDPAVGWVGCTASQAGPEACNGVDDDCDGAIDEGLPESQPCEATNEHGACAGAAVCVGTKGWLCQAPVPAAELCNGKDDDCDGAVDEDFRNGAGAYATFAHCGGCGQSCGVGFPHASQVVCDDGGAQPKCVVAACEAGWTPLDDFQCVPETAGLCEACTTDENCVLKGARCLPLSDGSYCGKPCAGAGDCPSGYACKPFGGGSQCFPVTNACGCDGTNTSLSRACDQTWQPPDPTQPSTTCYGVQPCTAAGWGTCQLPAEVCDAVDNDCDGLIDEGYKAGTGKYTQLDHCGQCGNNCSFLAWPNAVPFCDAAPAVPGCAMQCKAGWFDVDKNATSGCECKFISATDEPDLAGVDANCDGVDGEVGNGVFVSKTGVDTNAGTIDKPKRTVQAAVNTAAAQGKRDVYVATGVYQESVALAAGVGVYGGFRGDFLERKTALHETVILGQVPTAAKPGAVNAMALPATNTVFDGFTVFGYGQKAAGASSYAIYLKNPTSALTISNNVVFGGLGGNGTRGNDGADGDLGVVGAAGKAAKDVGVASCAGVNAGGGGGARVCAGTTVSGGKGGDATCPDYDQDGAQPKSNPYPQTFSVELGAKGSGPSGGGGGLAGYDSLFWSGESGCGICRTPKANDSSNFQKGPGDDGANGAVGGNGAAGTACATGGAVSNGLWTPATGGTGAGGGHGSGGGGGGAGGGTENWNCSQWGYSDWGGSGGGGGSGGCAGTGASAGTGGGGSFAVFVVWTAAGTSAPAITGNSIVTGTGGLGGDGGSGGTGGSGADGKPGGAPGDETPNAWCAEQGGNGGSGGNGGHGGGGGGGCGGASYGIYASGQGGLSITGWKSANLFTIDGSPGGGGKGGPSIGNAGKAGASGPFGASNF